MRLRRFTISFDTILNSSVFLNRTLKYSSAARFWSRLMVFPVVIHRSEKRLYNIPMTIILLVSIEKWMVGMINLKNIWYETSWKATTPIGGECVIADTIAGSSTDDDNSLGYDPRKWRHLKWSIQLVIHQRYWLIVVVYFMWLKQTKPPLEKLLAIGSLSTSLRWLAT